MTRAAVVALCAALLATSAHADKLVFDPGTIYKVPLGSAPADGPADAPITIVYWSDHACGYCYRVQATLDTLNRMFPGQIRWVHRTLPLDDDETLGAEAALAAAAQGQFRPMNDRLYALAGRVDRAAVELIARELGLDMVRFRAELDTRAHRAAIVAERPRRGRSASRARRRSSSTDVRSTARRTSRRSSTSSIRSSPARRSRPAGTTRWSRRGSCRPTRRRRPSAPSSSSIPPRPIASASACRATSSDPTPRR